MEDDRTVLIEEIVYFLYICPKSDKESIYDYLCNPAEKKVSREYFEEILKEMLEVPFIRKIQENEIDKYELTINGYMIIEEKRFLANPQHYEF